MKVSVAKTGGNFIRISDALISLKSFKESMGEAFAMNEKIIISIAPGVYEEDIVIPFSNISLIGESAKSTIIRGYHYAKEVLENGEKRGTFGTAVVRTDGDNIRLSNLTIENTAGPGKKVGQAVALYTDGDNITVEGCRLIAKQDTLFTAPLPETNKSGENKGFGPKQDMERRPGRHRFLNCYIEGDVDFIFGAAMALFEDCTIFSRKREIAENEVQGYVSAPSTPEGQPFGYLFYRCRFLSDCEKETVYLSRPWRNYAKSVIVASDIGAHIKPEGYFNWNKPEAELTTYYAEGSNTSEGGSNHRSRVAWAHLLTDEEAAKYVEDFKEALNA